MSNGYNIDNSLFELKFNPPQNFAAYRQAELDTTRANIYGTLQQVPYLSKRFAMKRYLGLSQEEIAENEKLWMEENGGNLQPPADAAGELRNAAITPGGIADDAAAQTAEAPADMAAAAEQPDAGGADAGAEMPAQ